ncbi:GATOR1 complex protein NPRL2-like isoform X1 [Liolophura sinensis]|uniref:GATOR1 complex protein NPRL2-like isoform X1 n=1 Tax=Liolophura sinensis TaxID=3198878 RepID=UPI003159409B
MLKAPDFIKCIFFSEFHPKKGPKITYQVPSNYISKEVFDAVHVYIITKPDLQNRLITINALGHKIVGCPVCIDDHKYKRNALIFNLCLVFDVLTQTCKYEIVVKKLATYLTQLELEREFLSNADSKQRLPEILQEILTKLNMCGHCSIPMSESNTIHLKVSPCVTDLPMIEEQDVPILLPDHSGPNLHHWDLTTQQIIGYIDGFNHVLRIASEADVEINLVKACVQNLLHYKVVKIISIFQYSNVYTATPDVTELSESKELQEECLKFVASHGRNLPYFRDVFKLYSNLTPGTTVRDLCSRYNPHGLRIDEKKLTQYGLMKGYIRRLNKYPVKLLDSDYKGKQLYQWCNGCHNYDEICCKTGLSAQELDEKLEGDPSIVIIWK